MPESLSWVILPLESECLWADLRRRACPARVRQAILADAWAGRRRWPPFSWPHSLPARDGGRRSAARAGGPHGPCGGHGLMPQTRAAPSPPSMRPSAPARSWRLQARVGECEQRAASLAAFAKLASHVAHEVRNPLSAIMLTRSCWKRRALEVRCDRAPEAAGAHRVHQKEADAFSTSRRVPRVRAPAASGCAHQSLKRGGGPSSPTSSARKRAARASPSRRRCRTTARAPSWIRTRSSRRP